MVTEVMQHLLRNGTNPIVTVLDCTKAFDLCKFSTLFSRILETGVPPIVVRCLMTVYEDQQAWVRWGQARSSSFPITNGTRQGSILSPTFWAVYCDLMIKELRALGVGAHVAGLFMGAACFADDVVLIAPCRQAMQLMLDQVQDFASRYNISFSTDPNPSKSKSKCIFVVGKRSGLDKPPPLKLCGRELPWVARATHLGHELHETGTMEHDASVKRAQFIDSSVEVRTLFDMASPPEIIKALKTYCSSFYGCMLWDLGGEAAQQVFSSWGTAIRLAWSCPRQTRTFLVQQVLSCGFTSARTDILTRYGRFFRGLRSSASWEVTVLANLVSRDLQTTTGKNLRTVKEASGLDPWVASPSMLKKAVIDSETVEVASTDVWRLEYLCSLLRQVEEAKLHTDDEKVKELQELIDSLVI